MRAWQPDVLVVAAYGKILPPSILALPRLAPINVHASLLPRHRGAAPIAAAILAGDDETGVTIMLMSEGMDEGDVLLQSAVPIAPDDTTATLTERLAVLGGATLVDALARLRSEGLAATPQDSGRATYAPRIAKEEGRIRWNEPAAAIARRVRAFTPWPSAFAVLGGQTVKILDARARRGGPAPPCRRRPPRADDVDAARTAAEGSTRRPARSSASARRSASPPATGSSTSFASKPRAGRR